MGSYTQLVIVGSKKEKTKTKTQNKQNNNKTSPIPQTPKSTPDIHKISINELNLYYKRISGD